jgi:hypothetical protein
VVWSRTRVYVGVEMTVDKLLNIGSNFVNIEDSIRIELNKLYESIDHTTFK